MKKIWVTRQIIKNGSIIRKFLLLSLILLAHVDVVAQYSGRNTQGTTRKKAVGDKSQKQKRSKSNDYGSTRNPNSEEESGDFSKSREVHHGFMASLMIGNSNMSSGSGGTSSNKQGFTFGYSVVPVQALGWEANFHSFNLTNNGSVGFMSFDGNATWGINSQMYAKGGLNYSMITSGLSNISTSGSFGFQFGGGFQFHPNMAVGLSYTTGNQSWKTSASSNGFTASTSGTFNESGFEIVLSGVLPYKF